MMFTMSCVEKGRVFPLSKYSGRDSGTTAAAEMDRVRNASEKVEAESPATAVVRNWNRRTVKVRAHNQILRIRAEDSHLGEDIGEGNLSLKDKFGVSQFMVLSRNILPASPLSGKNSC